MTYYNNYNPYGINQQTPIQPYGYQPNYMQPTQAPATNIIFVSGIEDVKSQKQLPNTEMFYADNDKPLLYKKKVYSNGQFEIKAFDITEHNIDGDKKEEKPIDLSGYVKTTDLDGLKGEIKALKEQVSKYNKLEALINGTRQTTTSSTT